MKKIIKDRNKYIIRFDPGEDVISGLEQFCKKEKITSGFFWGIGACKETELAFYDLKIKKYFSKRFKDLEIANMTGNIAKFEGKTIIHSHGTFSDKEMRTVAGHIKKLIVSATCEILLQAFEEPIERNFSEEIGLNLMD